MRFFVPLANDPHHAEEMYGQIRSHVENSVGNITDKRIYTLKFQHDGSRFSTSVGASCNPFHDGPLMAIFEGRDGKYYLCTQGHGAFEGMPHIVEKSNVVGQEEFSALA
jgi:hypothetical protein